MPRGEKTINELLRKRGRRWVAVAVSTRGGAYYRPDHELYDPELDPGHEQYDHDKWEAYSRRKKRRPGSGPSSAMRRRWERYRDDMAEADELLYRGGMSRERLSPHVVAAPDRELIERLAGDDPVGVGLRRAISLARDGLALHTSMTEAREHADAARLEIYYGEPFEFPED